MARFSFLFFDSFYKYIKDRCFSYSESLSLSNIQFYKSNTKSYPCGLLFSLSRLSFYKKNVLFALASVLWVECIRGWRASVGSVDGVFAWVAWVACLRRLRAMVIGVGDVLAWVLCQRR